MEGLGHQKNCRRPMGILCFSLKSDNCKKQQKGSVAFFSGLIFFEINFYFRLNFNYRLIPGKSMFI